MSKASYRQPRGKHTVLRSVGAAANAVWTVAGYIPRTHAKRTRVALVHDGDILLIQNVTNFRKWTLPGGGYHGSETAAECARREIREELAIDIPLKDFIPSGEFAEQQRGSTYRYDTFLVHLNDEPTLAISWELAHAKWVPINNLPHTVIPYVRHLLEDNHLL